MEDCVFTGSSAQDVGVFAKEVKQIGLRYQVEVEGVKAGSPPLAKKSFPVPVKWVFVRRPERVGTGGGCPW